MRPIRAFLLPCLLVLATFASGARAQSDEIQASGDMRRERSTNAASPGAPLIGFIESPSGHCYQPEPTQDVCYVAWAYLYVDAAPNYIVKLTVDLDNRRVFNAAGFFQTSLYVDRSTFGPLGFKVACGPPTVADPALGNSYPFTIRASDSASLTSSNFGSVTCPPYLN